MFPNTEWSGAAFYKYIRKKDNTTNMEETELMVMDFTLQDIGDGTYTEYDLGKETAVYLADHLDELLGCKIALEHSHHTLGAFFSGTDINTLKEQAEQCNNVLSLVVDNKGTYVAKFTEKHTIHADKDITIHTTETDKWKYMGEVEDNTSKTYDTNSKATEDYVEIRCWDCDIDRPLDVAIDNDFKKECIEKIDLFKKKKEEKTIKIGNRLKNISNEPRWYQPNLFGDGWDYNDYGKVDTKPAVKDMTSSIFQLSFSPSYYSSYWFKNYLDDKYSDEFYQAFLDAWIEFYKPNTEQLEKVIDEINLKTNYQHYDASRSVDTITSYLTSILEGYLDEEELTKEQTNEQQ